jgi:uncharacterized protein with GYD domain
MPVYITQGRYTREAIDGMINKPEDRAESVATLAKAAGAKLLHYFVTYGEYNLLVTMDSGKGESVANTLASPMTAAASGGVTDLKTTVGVTSKDAVEAMRAAKKMRAGFKTAGQ